ncbi:expressed unknown protein [Seminavis robusta]|uniref:Uncharacterized protein n=1 Tax=Seminavis robusta TaxID=568900 RepID=A0A9N8ENN2_9STRA|nr:expressed unknown protein [Seminavis robusta]|eukprot:Sro1241_g255380.1 n/a (201) ;mRNA; f:2769-3371
MQLWLLLTALLVLYPYSDASDCSDCVDQGCTFCQKYKGDSWGAGPGVCVCERLNYGFYDQNAGKDCSEISIGASELKSKPDCALGNQNGEGLTALFVVAGLFFVAVIGHYVYKRTKSKPPAYERDRYTPSHNSEPIASAPPTSSVLPVVHVQPTAPPAVHPTAPPEESNQPAMAAAIPIEEHSLRAQTAMTVSARPVPYR